MPFSPGELVDINHSGNPKTAVFRFHGRAYTVANGGLEVKRKGILKVWARVPREPGKYPYEFETDGQVVVRGHLRVRVERRTTAPPVTRPPRPAGVAARRHRGHD